jgi:hypothetical protein
MQNTGVNMSKIILICVSCLIVVGGCQSYDRSANLWLVNRSDHPIYYWMTLDSSYWHMELNRSYKIMPQDSVRPYLLYGPEGDGPDKNKWVNAINRGDDSALHVFFYHINFNRDPNRGDSIFDLIIHRRDYRVKSLEKAGWKVEYE